MNGLNASKQQNELVNALTIFAGYLYQLLCTPYLERTEENIGKLH